MVTGAGSPPFGGEPGGSTRGGRLGDMPKSRAKVERAANTKT